MRRRSSVPRTAFAAILVAIGLAAHLATRAEETKPPAPRVPCEGPIPALYDRVSPAVVSIATMSVNPYDVGERMTRVVGSGVLVDKSGLVLTNSHVVFARQAITVTLDDGTSIPARLVGADPIFDVALIRIPTPPSGELPVARLGDSERVLVGEDVFAIGNPFGLDQTFTRGIVSAVNRLLPNIPLSLTEPLIQTDAPINPGSSGGPLMDRCGEVIGITTALLPEAQNIGFAIPIDLIKSVLPSLVANGRVIRPWLGVRGQLVVQPLKDLLRVPLVDGFLVEIVEPGSPAEKAGLHGGRLDLTIGGESVLIGGDVVTEIDGSPVSDLEKINKALRSLEVGATKHLKVFHDGETREVDVTLIERPLLPEDIPARRSEGRAEATVGSGALGPFRSVRRGI